MTRCSAYVTNREMWARIETIAKWRSQRAMRDKDKWAWLLGEDDDDVDAAVCDFLVDAFAQRIALGDSIFEVLRCWIHVFARELN